MTDPFHPVLLTVLGVSIIGFVGLIIWGSVAKHHVGEE